MQSILLKIKRVEIKQFDPRKFAAIFRIFYSNNEKEFSFDFSHDFKTRSEVITEKIIKEVKSRAKPEENYQDDILDSLYTIKLIDGEKVEEKLINFFSKLNEKVKFLKIEKNYQRYMAQIADFNSIKLNLESDLNVRSR
ncbi:MAG: hypothetical protein AABY07_09290 [Nanoarchaeota archaeon]